MTDTLHKNWITDRTPFAEDAFGQEQKVWYIRKIYPRGEYTLSNIQLFLGHYHNVMLGEPWQPIKSPDIFETVGLR